jgi:hypothetical protein
VWNFQFRRDVLAALQRIEQHEAKDMAAIDDLVTAVKAMALVDAAETDAISKAVAVMTNPQSSDAQVEAAAQAILTSNQNRSTAAASLVAVLPPAGTLGGAPTPTPLSGPANARRDQRRSPDGSQGRNPDGSPVARPDGQFRDENGNPLPGSTDPRGPRQN